MAERIGAHEFDLVVYGEVDRCNVVCHGATSSITLQRGATPWQVFKSHREEPQIKFGKMQKCNPPLHLRAHVAKARTPDETTVSGWLGFAFFLSV